MMKFCSLALMLLMAGQLAAQQMVIEIAAGKYARKHCPVQVSLPDTVDGHQLVKLVSAETGKEILGEITNNNELFFWIDSMQAYSVEKYKLYFYLVKKRKEKNLVTIQQKKNGLQLKVGKKPVLFYNTKLLNPPADSPRHFARSGFIHPLYSPGGQVLTDDFPVGHTHQHALFTAWTKTQFRNEFIDFWNQHLGKGTVEHVEVLAVSHQKLKAEMTVILRQKSTAFGEVLTEKWKLTLFPSADYFLFDLALEQTNTTTDTLYLQQHVYGGLGFRGSRQWNAEDKAHYTNTWQVRTDSGYTGFNANNRAVRWVSTSGKIDGRDAGLAVFGFPSNFRYPQTIRVHPTMPYFSYSPVIDAGFFIAPGAVYKAKYRFMLYSGAPNAVDITQVGYQITDPVSVKIVRRET